MEFDIDAAEILGFADNASSAGAMFNRELVATNGAILLEGVGLAQEYAPRGESGNLANSITIIDGPDPSGGRYGSDLIYAWMREEGGTIYGNPLLVFEWNGKLVFARKVTQTGTHYMERSAEALEPRAQQAYEMLADRVLEQL